ncbi:MAG: glycosyltransferase family 4 protein [Alphaproteobacteria bacterium]
MKNSEMPDILVIGARGIPDAEGGAEKHAERLFPLFAKHGYRVTLLGISRFIRARSYRGVVLRRIPTVALAGTDKLVYHFFAFLYAAIVRPRIVHLQGLNSAFFLLLYKLCGLKVIMRYGSADHEYAKWGIIGRLGFRLCELQIRYADHVIAVSQKYKETLQHRYGLERISVIPNGLDRNEVNAESLAYWQGLGLEGVRYVLAIGRVTVDKDYDTLVEAVTSLADKKVVLVVAGGPDEKGYSDRFFDHSNKRIRFLGCVDRSLLPALYTNCAVYVNCSHYEGLSNAILEAISFNRPVIASDIPANMEMDLRECSYFCTGDAAALRERIEQALAEPEALMADKEHFYSWEEIYLKTENVYHEVLPDLLTRRPVVSGGQG